MYWIDTPQWTSPTNESMKIGSVSQSSILEKSNFYKCYPRVVGTAKCGDKGYYMDLEGGDGYIEMESRTGAIAIRIKGHSMHPAIKEDWFVIIEPDKDPVPGEYVLVKFMDGRKMVKELLHKKTDGYLLLSVNGNERITDNHDEIEGIEAITAIVPPSMHKDW
jgi:phage repressor protein C with HTH and peptisase S24 domain